MVCTQWSLISVRRRPSRRHWTSNSSAATRMSPERPYSSIWGRWGGVSQYRITWRFSVSPNYLIIEPVFMLNWPHTLHHPWKLRFLLSIEWRLKKWMFVQVTVRFRSEPGDYIIVPCTFEPNSGERKGRGCITVEMYRQSIVKKNEIVKVSYQ